MASSYRRGERTVYYWLVKAIFWIPVRIYFRFRVAGLEQIPRRGPFIVVANHSSFLDPILLGSACPRKIRFFVLRRMYDLMRLCWFYVGMDTIPVGGTEGDRRSIRIALRWLGRGHVLGIFPEGARSADGRLGIGKQGAAFLAARARVPVVPAFIAGAFEAMPAGIWFPRPMPVQVLFGKPIRFGSGRGGNGRRVDLDGFSRTIQDRIGDLQRQSKSLAAGQT